LNAAAMIEVTEYIGKKQEWKSELEFLRNVLRTTGMEETMKWGAPVYTNKGKNIVGLSAFKNYVGLWFFQGGTLKDTQKVLVNAQEGKTKAMRQWRFSTLENIDVDVLKSYVFEAIENQESGNIIKPKKNTKPLIIHEAFQRELDNNLELKRQFEVFSLSKKKEYTEYVSEAKREATQLKRLEKIIPMILNGVGLHDKYKNC
jgi:uncharacterized protein YdeI (YjbR/CyaY-like superfamily)